MTALIRLKQKHRMASVSELPRSRGLAICLSYDTNSPQRLEERGLDRYEHLYKSWNVSKHNSAHLGRYSRNQHIICLTGIFPH
jgi:hypothetical protein